MTTPAHAIRLIPIEQADYYASLPGQPVTTAFLRGDGAVVMADAASSLTSLLPYYEVVSVDIQPYNATHVHARIEYRQRLITCEICGREYPGIPEWWHVDLGPMRQHRWCSPECWKLLVAKEQANVAQRRQEIGDLVEAGMRHLRQRQAVPSDIRAYMTPDEWNALLKQCDSEWSPARHAFVDILAAHIETLTANTQHTTPVFATLQATPMSLFVEDVA